jgi:hypothetical protein
MNYLIDVFCVGYDAHEVEFSDELPSLRIG